MVFFCNVELVPVSFGEDCLLFLMVRYAFDEGEALEE